jgi:hypothetical protein
MPWRSRVSGIRACGIGRDQQMRWSWPWRVPEGVANIPHCGTVCSGDGRRRLPRLHRPALDRRRRLEVAGVPRADPNAVRRFGYTPIPRVPGTRVEYHLPGDPYQGDGGRWNTGSPNASFSDRDPRLAVVAAWVALGGAQRRIRSWPSASCEWSVRRCNTESNILPLRHPKCAAVVIPSLPLRGWRRCLCPRRGSMRIGPMVFTEFAVAAPPTKGEFGFAHGRPPALGGRMRRSARRNGGGLVLRPVMANAQQLSDHSTLAARAKDSGSMLNAW